MTETNGKCLAANSLSLHLFRVVRRDLVEPAPGLLEPLPHSAARLAWKHRTCSYRRETLLDRAEDVPGSSVHIVDRRRRLGKRPDGMKVRGEISSAGGVQKAVQPDACRLEDLRKRLMGFGQTLRT